MENQDFEPFPTVRDGEFVLNHLEYRPLSLRSGLAKWRVQEKDRSGEGSVFLVTLFGATRTKMEDILWRKLTEADIETAIQRAIARETRKWRRRGAELPRGESNPIEVTIRDEDFAPGRSIW